MELIEAVRIARELIVDVDPEAEQALKLLIACVVQPKYNMVNPVTGEDTGLPP